MKARQWKTTQQQEKGNFRPTSKSRLTEEKRELKFESKD